MIKSIKERSNLKKIGIIPARMASARFPGKPMQMVGNQTILQRVYYQAASSKLDQIVIASGDDVILNHCQQNNFKNIETKGDFANGTERCSWVSNQLKFDPLDLIVNIQCDELFIHPDDFNNIINEFDFGEDYVNFGVVTLIGKIKDEERKNRNCVKALKTNADAAMYFTREFVPTNWKHIGIYAYQKWLLNCLAEFPLTELEQSESLEQIRWLENDIPIKMLKSDSMSVSINSPEDLMFFL